MCAQCTFSQGPAGDCLLTSSSDINPLSPSNGTPTAAPCCESEPSRDGFPACTCTKETLGCSIHPNTRDEWIASQRASLVRIFQQQAKARESTAHEAGSSPRSSCQLSLYDLDSSFLRTAQTSSPVALASFSGRLPQSGLMRSGAFVPLPTLARPTSASAGGALRGVPTPTCQDKHGSGGRMPGIIAGTSKAHPGMSLTDWVRKWPTPRATDGSHGGRVTPRKGLNGGNLIEAVSAARFATPTEGDCYGSGPNQHTKTLGRQIKRENPGGLLSPNWVEWIMGWPINWTFLPKRVMMSLSRSKRRR